MKVNIVTSDVINGDVLNLDSRAKTLIVCGHRKEFHEIQIRIVSGGVANLAIPVLWDRLEIEKLENYLIALNLCSRGEGGLEVGLVQHESKSIQNSGQAKCGILSNEQISILLRQWDSYEMTSECLNSLLSTNYEHKRILLLDDASKDDSSLRLFFAYPSIHVVRTLDRLEYCNSFNFLAKYAEDLGSEFIYIVNNDTSQFSPEIFDELIAHLNPGVGIISSRVKDYFGNIIVKEDRKWLGIEFNIATEGYLIRLATWNRIGGFNPNLVRYAEDLDIVREMKKLGLGQKRVDTVYFSHLGNGSSSRQNFTPIYFAARNLVWIQKIYFPSGRVFSMVKKSAEKTWPSVLKKNTFTGKRSVLIKLLYLILGLLRGAFTNCHPRNPHADPYFVLFRPPMRFTQKLR